MQPKLDKIKFLHDSTPEGLQRKVQMKVRAGYEFVGSMQYLNEEYHLTMVKIKYPSMEE